MANDRSTPGQGDQGQTMDKQGTQDQHGQNLGQGQGQYRDDSSKTGTNPPGQAPSSGQPNVGQTGSTSPTQTPREPDMTRAGSGNQERTKTSGVESGSGR